MSRQLSYARLDKLRTQDQTSANGSIIGALNWNYSYNVDKQVTAENTLGSFLSSSSFAASYDPGDRLVKWNRSASPVGGARQTEAWTMPSVPSRHKQSPFLLRKGTLKRAETLSPVVDDAGNHNSVTRDGTTQNRTHNSDNELVSIAGDTTTRDAKGNTTEDAQGNKYFYDLDNRIYEIRMDNGDKIELQYDALGRRVFRKQGSDETAFLWWGDQETSEHESKAGQPVIQNDLWAHPTALNKIIARAVEGDENDIEYYHKNYLDHVYAVSDDNGNIDEHYRYTAFGEVEVYSPTGAKLNGSAIGNTVMWNSRRFDETTELYYYKYRHYKADIGRWLGRDPIEENGGHNLYEFVANKPINLWDLLGLTEGSAKNLEKRKALNDAAKNSEGTKKYNLDAKTPRTGKGELKCTDYVYAISRANKKTPKIPAKRTKSGGYMYPLAKDLADPNHKMKNWRQLKKGEKPEPGDIASTGVHAGVITDNAAGNVSAHVVNDTSGSAVYGTKDQFRGNPNTVYWRYTGN